MRAVFEFGITTRRERGERLTIRIGTISPAPSSPSQMIDRVTQ